MRNPAVKPNDQIAHGDQVFTCRRLVSYQRRDGRKAELATFTTECAVCGETFEFSTSAYFTRLGFNPARICFKHRRQANDKEDDTKSGTVVSGPINT